MMKRLSVLIGTVLLFLPTVASASPWTLPAGDLVLATSYDFEVAEQEFLDKSTAQNFPLNGRFNASTFSTAIRYGLLDQWELEVSVPLKMVAYNSDPVILLPGDDFDGFQENVIDLSQSIVGFGDIGLAVRHQFIRGPVVVAGEMKVKSPSGYADPEGTFGASPQTSEAFLEDIETLVRPENVRDDVTLGDGALEIAPSLLVGYAAPFGLFARADAGYRFRFDGAGDQVAGAIKVGQTIGSSLIVFAGSTAEIAVVDGRVIGISVAAADPDLPATEYSGTDNIELREVTLDRDRVGVEGGAIIRLRPGVELNMAYRRTVWGRNTSLTQGFSIGVVFRTNITE